LSWGSKTYPRLKPRKSVVSLIYVLNTLVLFKKKKKSLIKSSGQGLDHVIVLVPVWLFSILTAIDEGEKNPISLPYVTGSWWITTNYFVATFGIETYKTCIFLLLNAKNYFLIGDHIEVFTFLSFKRLIFHIFSFLIRKKI
jgi:hypothetical protein